MSWGHIVSTDMLSWTQANPAQALLPDEPYDCDGVFTGCWIPAAAEGFDKTVLTVAYSSVRKLPFHWSMPSYPRDAAGLSIAVSRDGGRVWTKSTRNPVLSGEPVVLDVTGWRDPYVTELPALDAVRGTGEADVLYGLVSGGIRGVGPTTFLYEIRRQNLEDWRYICPLVDLPQRFQPSEKWSGNYGINWECTNIVTLQAGAESRHFLIIGAEGDAEKEHVKSYARLEGAPLRTVRAQLWMSGRLDKNGDDIKFRHEHGGYLDHGPYYAATRFWIPCPVDVLCMAGYRRKI
jgi:beta-fructofuranosidase